MNSTSEISLTDQYALLLENSVKESRNLREELSEKDERYSATLAQLNAKIDALTEKVASQSQGAARKGKRKTTAKVEVPRLCRVSPNTRNSPNLGHALYIH